VTQPARSSCRYRASVARCVGAWPVFGKILVSLAAAPLGACALAMQLTSFQEEAVTTQSIPNGVSPLSANLDEEDWRRAQSALSLAVDPLGSGQPVNWDNPGSKRRGTFTPSGPLVLAEDTVCRPFRAMIVEPQPKASETLLEGQSCRIAPGEWMVKSVKTLNAPQIRDQIQPLPGKSAPLVPAMTPKSG
jgi:surface antigen